MIETVILSLDLVLLKRGGWRSGANGHKSVIKKARISLVVFEIAWRHPGDSVVINDHYMPVARVHLWRAFMNAKSNKGIGVDPVYWRVQWGMLLCVGGEGVWGQKGAGKQSPMSMGCGISYPPRQTGDGGAQASIVRSHLGQRLCVTFRASKIALCPGAGLAGSPFENREEKSGVFTISTRIVCRAGSGNVIARCSFFMWTRSRWTCEDGCWSREENMGQSSRRWWVT